MTKDGALMVAAANDRLFARLWAAIGRPELADDERFRTNPDRVANREQLVPQIRDELRRQTSEHWLAALDGIPVAPVQDVAEVAAHEQTPATGMLQELDGLETVPLPLQVDGDRLSHHSPPPVLGQHSAEVLRELGYTDAEVAALAAAAITRLP